MQMHHSKKWQPAKAKSAAKEVTGSGEKQQQKIPSAPRESLQVIVNGSIVSESKDQPGQWNVDLRMGTNEIEIGEKGGALWRMLLERTSVA